MAESEDDSDGLPQKASPSGSPRAKLLSVVEPAEVEKEISLPVTVSPGGKRFRVNEIGAQRPVEKRTQKALPAISKSTGKWASNETLVPTFGVRDEEELPSGSRHLRGTLIWVICAGALVILIVAGAILMNRPPKEGSEIKRINVATEPSLEQTTKENGFKSGKTPDALINAADQAKGLFARYATAKSVDDFIGMIYQPDRNGALIAKYWEPMGVAPGGQPGQNGTWTVIESGGVQYGILAGALANRSGFSAIFRKDGDAIKMDWKATTGHSSASYSKLKQGHGDGTEIRAILSLGDFHTFTLPEGEFRCYRLTAPDREENVWAYTKRNSANDTLLASQFVPNQITGEAVREIPVVLALVRGPEQSLPNQWIISKVVRLDWLDE